ncbi:MULTISPECIES: helix-turn-helix domain-containing protein [unclassified Brevundimonas]|jgi:hypothetical protein|uniref:helix-turn-helix domain-containing protein n=1 Tax=unclassified Brevundimonas TaxID=2622653 RepID=UPI0025C3E497|nr:MULTISPECIES: helix-turn-helix transcriptional regulator [unclassified Brevundimonas]
MADLDPIDVEIGARVKQRREALGLTQQALASAIGVTFQQVQKYEKGTNRISASRLVRISETLHSPPAALLSRADDAGPIAAGLLDTPGAVQLLEAYCAIRSPRHRDGLLAMAKALDAV